MEIRLKFTLFVHTVTNFVNKELYEFYMNSRGIYQIHPVPFSIVSDGFSPDDCPTIPVAVVDSNIFKFSIDK